MEKSYTTVNEQPIELPEGTAPPPAKTAHKPEAGEVGDTGEHGAIGSNAAE